MKQIQLVLELPKPNPKAAAYLGKILYSVHSHALLLAFANGLKSCITTGFCRIVDCACLSHMQPFQNLGHQAPEQMAGEAKKVPVSNRWSCTTLGDGLSQLAAQSEVDEDEATLLAQLQDQKGFNL